MSAPPLGLGIDALDDSGQSSGGTGKFCVLAEWTRRGYAVSQIQQQADELGEDLGPSQNADEPMAHEGFNDTHRGS
jgi:hypothetical protein